MPSKVCTLQGPDCEGVYWSRWRNGPAVCESCALYVAACPGCRAVQLRADDPAQLALFPAAELTRLGVWWSIDALLAHHFANRAPRPGPTAPVEERPPWPTPASDAERRRYPFH